MTNEVRVFIPSIPVAQPRQRHRIVTSGGKPFATNYTPTNSPVNTFKACCQMAARQAYSGQPIDEPIIVDMVFVMPRPKSLIWKNKPMPRCPCATKKNDRDNLMKSTQDALNGLLWTDDGLIWRGETTKVYAAGNEQPHVELIVRWGTIGDTAP